MPKRRNRSSYSVSPRKSPRKSNTTANTTSSGDKEGKDDEDKEPTEPVIFQLEADDGTTVDFSVCTKFSIKCLDKDDKEIENEIPCDDRALDAEIVSNRPLQQLAASIISTPSKRASPLSPTLLDNVQQQQQVQTPVVVQPPVETPRPVTPDHNDVSKIESDLESSVASPSIISRPRRKRRRLYSDTPPPQGTETDETNNTTTTTLPDQTPKAVVEATPLPTLSDTPTSRHRKGTSQKVSLRSPVKKEAASEKVELPQAVFRVLEDYNLPDMDPPMEKDKYLKWIPPTKEELCKMILYELDEVDIKWLDTVNKKRRNYLGLDIGDVTLEEMELLLDRMEKEYYFELQNSGLGQPGESDEDAVCCICLIGESENTNQIIFCDMCNIPVHQDCYGVPFIPEGCWLCRRCQISPHGEIECIFCPQTDGALKQTVDGRWAHVLCALWIPEVRFANPSLVEPVDDVDDIPPARWKLTCFLCRKKGVGACIQCHLRSCVTAFHVTCAQAAGLSLKVETKDTNNSTVVVRMSASCDKHTSQRDRDALTKKWETVNTVLNEKRCAPVKAAFPAIPQERLSALVELVTFPGKQMFLKRLYSYWRLKRKDKGGAPLMRNLDSVWTEGIKYPPTPDPLLRPPLAEDFVTSYYENMTTLHRGLTKLSEYCSLVKDHAEMKRDEIKLRAEIILLQLERVDEIFLDVIDKLWQKDKQMVFTQPVTEDEAPGYCEKITHPMDLSTMRNKAIHLEYSSLEELEADFALMINNCTTYNKKSSYYYKFAIKLSEYSIYLFQAARDAIVQREKDRLLAAEEERKKKLVQKTLPEVFFKTEAKQNVNYERLRDVLTRILDQLQKRDVHDIFAEPVDLNEVPDYLDIVKEPMDFSTMRSKINSNQYSSIEDFSKDFELMLKNCVDYNPDESVYFKEAFKMAAYGRKVISKAKVKYGETMVEIKTEDKVENNNNESFEIRSVKVEPSSEEGKQEGNNDTFLYEVMSDVLAQLIDRDDQQIFAEPVNLEDYPDYLDEIQEPMDLSTMEKKLKDSVYTSLDELERDFNLMITNCKTYNAPRSVYYGIAKLMKTFGDKVFRTARKKLSKKV